MDLLSTSTGRHGHTSPQFTSVSVFGSVKICPVGKQIDERSNEGLNEGRTKPDTRSENRRIEIDTQLWQNIAEWSTSSSTFEMDDSISWVLSV